MGLSSGQSKEDVLKIKMKKVPLDVEYSDEFIGVILIQDS